MNSQAMTTYIGTGARINGTRPTSKKALKEALAAAPDTVTFDPTSVFDNAGTIRGDAIPPGVTLTVTGPDPYTSRKYYASVTLGRNNTPRLT